CFEKLAGVSLFSFFEHVFWNLFRLRVLVAPIQARGRRQSFGGPSAAPLARQDKGLDHRPDKHFVFAGR
ncbi:hypothetical protein, partial [Rhizobium leguminosarum]|uniref:hypothetical protein n=1 Tax=Rhizobium leguminosarum TaxID=384 RepID=UPI003F9B5980